MTEIVVAIASKVSEYLVAPIGRQLSYLFCYRSHMDDLNNKVQELGSVRGDLQITVDEAKERGDEIRPIVEDWLTRADKNTGEAKTFMEDEKKRTKSCFNGWCPNLKSRCQLGREAEEKAQVIIEIQKARNFPDGVSYRVPAPNVTAKNYDHFESRAAILNEIMDALRDDNKSMIGVWGMGGVGKTTLVEQVAAQAKQEKLFDKVVMAYVSQTVDLKKIQAQIADALGLKFEEESETGRAGRLSVRLTEEKNILIILDDLWAGLNLKDVGIPSDHKGLKMVVTSRELHVLSNEMGTQNNFAVEHLPPEEAWSLFKKMAGDSIEKSDLKPTAEEVLKKCGGLPIAIVTVAKALKGKDPIAWKDALRQLTRSIETTVKGIEAKIFLSLELSYNSLHSNEVKSLFLLCGLLNYGDTEIDLLFRYGVGLDLFQNINSLEEAWDRLHTLINNLKASSLLLESSDDAYVRMHDVVREVARAIASKDPHRFVVREDDRFRESKRCTFLSLNCRAAHELPKGLVCPELKLFLLYSNNPSLNIPNTFFEGMKQLRVLDLSRMPFTTLPSSLDSLANLQTLRLDWCLYLVDIALIGKLTKLEVLSLVGSRIQQLPNEMMQLTNLRLLDLNYCSQLEVIPRNILSSLSRLECLYMKSSFTKWAVEGESNACLSELNHLSHLTALVMKIPDVKLLPKEDTFFENLTRYSIFIGERRLDPDYWMLKRDWMFHSDCRISRTLKLNEVDRSLHLGNGIGKLLKKSEELELWKLSGTKSTLYELNKEGFCKLKHLEVSESPEIQYVIDSKDQQVQQHGAFPLLESLILYNLINLEEVFCSQGKCSQGNLDIHVPFSSSQVSFSNLEKLKLDYLPKLKMIWHHQLSFGSFNNLQILQVRRCLCLLNLIPSHLIQRFNNLKKMQVYDCEVLEHVFDLQGLDRNVGILPKLETLELERLPKLRYIINNEDKNDSMRYLLSPPTLMDFQSLKCLSIKNCGNADKEDVVLFGEKVLFSNLEKLEIYNLPKLNEIWHYQLSLDSFSNLQILKVTECPRLLNFIPCHLIQNFKNLNEIQVSECEVLKHVFDFQGLHRNVVILPKLETLNLERLHRLKSIICNEDKNDNMRCLFSPPMLMDFQNLKHLSIKDCVKEGEDEGHVNTPTQDIMLFGEKVSFPNLEELKLDGLPKLKMIWHHQLPIESFCKLRILSVRNCPHLVNLVPSHLILSFQNLKEVDVCDCEVLERVFDHREPNGDVGILPKIEILKLEELPRLRLIICNEEKNDNMRYLLSPFNFKDFHHLKELLIINCVMLSDEKPSFLDGVSNYEAFESRASTFNNIMDALRDDHTNLIGVVGFGGVGNTTLLKQVAQQAKQQHLFKRQAYIDLSSIPDSNKLRQKIANALGFRLWRPNADDLKQKLKKEKILIILDHIRTEVDLEEVGIPSKGDETQCKIVLASRDGDLLCKNMGAQMCFPVEHLPPEEAWHLFKKTAGDSVEENLELRPIAIQVVEECEGLPISIVTIAKALKDESVAVWKNALDELWSSAPTNIRGVDDKVYRCLKWCYNQHHLKDDEVKSLFLLCGMLGYGDISLDHLLQYGMGLDLFDRIDSLEQARNRLLALVEILKASGLFLDSHEDTHNFDEERPSSLLFMDADNKFVRMHDVVYDVAREIASKDPHPFVVKEGAGLEEWSKTDESKSCTFISLNCKAVPELPHGLVCPELQFFLFHNNNPSLNIPNTFFEGMKNLKVLDLSKMPFTTLPSSLDSLENLRTLRLDGCKYLVDIALIGKLTKLEVLSLVGSTIQQLPNEMVQLTNLRLLNLNDCRQLKVIPRNILSSLSRLECLYMNSSFTQWAVEGESNACLSELNHLSHLTTLDIQIPDAKFLPKDILFENLTRYAIFMGDSRVFQRDCKTKRALKLDRVNISLHLGDGINKLLERSEELEFMRLSGTKYVLRPSNRESFLELKHLQDSYSHEIQYIIDSKDLQFPQQGPFPLHNLEEVWHDPIPTGPFGNLKTLHVERCDGLKFLFLPSTASNNLQLFPKLRSLKLKSLPQLINFSSKLETTSSTSLSTNARLEGSFFNHQVSFPKLEELELIDLPELKDIWHHQLPFGSFCNLQILKVYYCPCLLNLVPSHLIHSFKNLKKIDVQDCKLLEHVVILQGIDENVKILPKLETLNLKDLPKLRWIEDGNDSMKYISSPVRLMNIQNLKELQITNCRMEDRRKM